MHSIKSQSGVGLIEVLVAVVLISIGFLAVAKMQVEGMRYSQSAYFNSQAIMMLKDMSDRMRSNRAGITDGHYNNLETNNSTTLPTCVSSNAPCTPADLAQKDLYEWSAYLHAPANANNFVPTLPSAPNINAKGTVVVTAGVYDITVQWGERIDDNYETQSLSVQFIP